MSVTQYETHHFEDSGSASTDNAYLELDLNHDEYMDQFDMVSSLTMTRSGGGTLSGSRSESSPGSSPHDIGHKSIIRSSPWSSMVSSVTNGGRRKGKRAIITVNGVPPVQESKEENSGESITSKSYIDSVQSEVRSE